MKKTIRYRNFVIRILPASNVAGFIFWKKNKKLSVDYMSYTAYSTVNKATKICKASIDRDWNDYHNA